MNDPATDRMRGADSRGPTAPVTTEPPARFAGCPDCGRSKSDWLTLLEVHERYGYAKTSCFTCCLSDHKRTDFAPTVEALDPR